MPGSTTDVSLGPWPAEHGYGARRSAPLPIAGEGSIAWTCALPDRGARALLTNAQGQSFVASSKRLSAVDARGQLNWQIDLPLVHSIVLLPDDQLAVAELEQITIRSQQTGRTLATWPAAGTSSLGLTQDRTLIYTAFDDALGRYHLYNVSLAGEILWRQALAGQSDWAPLALPSAIVVADNDGLRGYGHDGRPLWIASHDAFHGGGAIGAARLHAETDPAARVVSQPAVVDAQRLVVGLQWPAGSAYVLVDIAKSGVQTVLSPVGPARTATIFDHGLYGPGLVTDGPAIHHGPDLWEQQIVCLSLDGEVRWDHNYHGELRSLISDQAGQTALACSPLVEIWDAYQSTAPLVGHAFIEVVRSNGEKAWRWVAPGPITSPLAVGADGGLLCVVDGVLHCLGQTTNVVDPML